VLTVQAGVNVVTDVVWRVVREYSVQMAIVTAYHMLEVDVLSFFS
jgi:hypothetical protein